MKKKFYGLFVICMLLGLSSCDDFLDDVKAAGTEYDKPVLEGSMDSLDKTLVRFLLKNIIDVDASYGAPIIYTGHYAAGEHSKIPTEGVTDFPFLPCPAAGTYNRTFNALAGKGKYTFWLTGKYDYGGKGKTDPSNAIVLDFVE